VPGIKSTSSIHNTISEKSWRGAFIAFIAGVELSIHNTMA
jgi:hypothetical protein